MMRKKNNNRGPRHGGGGHGGGGGGRRYHGGGGGGGNRGGNDSNNLARQKHHAMQMREKYSSMARDAQINGDRPDAEYYLQHVDHYQRVLADIGVIEAERFAQHREQQQTQGTPVDNVDHAAQPDNQQGGGGDEGMQPSNQPRMTRPPRPQHQQQQHQQSQQHYTEGGNEPQQAAPASGSNEIPLPGSVLTAL